MERQYIGARYVPKFFENPSSPDSAWLAGVAYEPLTIVTYAGNSYTSKKPVPAGIGSPNLNSDYWAPTGIYNQQVESIRQDLTVVQEQVADMAPRLSAVEDTVEELTEKEYIAISDSYGNYQNASSYNFVQLAFQHIGVTNYHDFHRGSAGFSRAGDLNFLKVLQDNESTITDKTKISDIFVFGAANDQLAASQSEIGEGISAFCNYCRANYPNAKIYIGVVSRSYDGAYVAMLPVVERAYSYAGRYGATYLNGSENIMAWNQMFRADHVHPTETAVDTIGNYVADLLLSGSCFVEYDPILNDNFTVDPGDFSFSMTADYSITKFKNGVFTLEGRNGGTPFTVSCTMPSMASGSRLTVKLKNVYVPPRENNTHTANGFCIVVAQDGTHYVQCTFSMVRNPNSDNTYTCNILFFPETAISNVTSITPSFKLVAI